MNKLKYIAQVYNVACNRCGDTSVQVWYRGFYAIGKPCRRCFTGTYVRRVREQWEFELPEPVRKVELGK